MLIDTHAHVYDELFALDLEENLNKATEAGVEKIYMPNCDSSTIEAMLDVEKKYPDLCKAMMGLHPCYVKENVAEELATVKNWLEKRKFSAVGEIGLDYYWDKTFKAQQQNALHQQIEWALDYHLPIVLHTRDAMQDTIDIVKQYASKNVCGVFHCFSGSYESALEIIKMNMYIGIGGVITFKNAGVQEVVAKLDLNNIVLETDAPYLAPAPFRGKRNECSYLTYIAQKIADLKNISIEEVIEITSKNARALYKDV
jgi:TatD DNase family protein